MIVILSIIMIVIQMCTKVHMDKQYNEGIKYFSKILNYDKNNFYYSYALFYMGLSNESLGQIDETIKYYDMYLKDYPSEAYASGVAYSLMLIYENVDIDKKKTLDIRKQQDLSESAR